MILAQKLRVIWIDACLDQDLGLNRSDVMSALDLIPLQQEPGNE